MKRPRVGQRVWADGFAGTFTVVKVYAHLRVADLELTSGMKKIQVHLPFSAIHTVGDYLDESRLIDIDTQ
jgi:hypothetical protein